MLWPTRRKTLPLSRIMRGSQEVCTLCRNLIRPSRTTIHGRRAASFRTRSQETFNASKLVLDLDAADSKYVRRYEDSQEGSATTVAVLDELKPHKRVSKQTEQNSLRKRRTLPDIYRATDVDYMAFALLGDPMRHPSHANEGLRKVLYKNMLSSRLGGFKDHIQWLKENAEQSAMPDSVAQSSSVHHEEKYRSRILACQKFLSLRRTTAVIAKTSVGCQYIASNGDIVVKAIRTCRRTDSASTSASQVLKYINALVQRLKAMHVDPGPSLCEAGMYYAAKTQNYPALKVYIDIVTAKRYRVGESRPHALRVSVSRIKQPWEHPMLGSYNKAGDWRRRDLLKLLTGWDTAGVPDEGEERKPSFAVLVQDSTTMYSTYITSLGKLGATEALWYEWSHPELTPMPSRVSETEVELEERADIFVDAFLLAKDSWRALQVLNNPTNRDQSLRTEIDLAGREQKKKLREALLAHYHLHGLSDVNAGRLKADLASMGLDEPEKALVDVERLLKVNWVENGTDKGFHVRV